MITNNEIKIIEYDGQSMSGRGNIINETIYDCYFEATNQKVISRFNQSFNYPELDVYTLKGHVLIPIDLSSLDPHKTIAIINEKKYEIQQTTVNNLGLEITDMYLFEIL